MISRRVVITGQGIICPLGTDSESFHRSLMAGKSGIGQLKANFADKLNCRVAAQLAFDPAPHFSPHQVATLDRVTQFALVAARQATDMANLELSSTDLSRCGVCVGTGMAGAESLDNAYASLYQQNATRLKPFTVLMAMNSAAASHIAMELGTRGPCLTFSTACSSSSIAIGEAFRLIRHGYADTVVAGGAEALLTYGTIRAWESLRTLAKVDEANPSASCKPFSKDRSGLVLGEGAAMIVLESREKALARGATVLAELVGYGSCNDCSHITQPSVAGQSEAMRTALNDARLAPSAIGYINAHGTGTLLNDLTETQAIKSVFGAWARHILVSSTKSMHGHMMGAAGAVELVACIQSLRHQEIPPTQHLIVPDPECDLDYVPCNGRPVADLDFAISNSFAFGGTSAVLVMKRA